MEDLQAYYRGSLRDRVETLESAREALSRRDPGAADSVRRIAHSLKGTGASYGFPEITEAAAAVLEADGAAVLGSTAALIEVLRRIAGGAGSEG